MYFSISAPQNVTLPDGQVLSFRVNAVDSSLVEIHVLGTNDKDEDGTRILTFKRNGAPSDTTFVPVEKPKETAVDTKGPTADASAADAKPPAKPYPSVDKDAVRADDWQTTRDMTGKPQVDSSPKP